MRWFELIEWLKTELLNCDWRFHCILDLFIDILCSYCIVLLLLNGPCLWKVGRFANAERPFPMKGADDYMFMSFMTVFFRVPNAFGLFFRAFFVNSSCCMASSIWSIMHASSVSSSFLSLSNIIFFKLSISWKWTELPMAMTISLYTTFSFIFSKSP